MFNTCGFNSTTLNKKIYKPDVRSNVGLSQVTDISNLSRDNQLKAVYSAHKSGYKNIKIHSAYLGEINVDVYDTGNGYAALQTVVSGINNGPAIFVKTLDVQVHSLYPDKYQYDIRYLSQVQPTFIDIKKAEKNYKTIQELEAKKKMLEVTDKKLEYYDQKRLHEAYIYNNAVDIHFNTCNYLDFLHKYTGQNNVINNNVLISLHNVKKLDNAFWTGEYMVYGNGDNMFYPLGTIDIGGHEAGHGLVQSAAGLKYQGHSGALNESFADVIGVCFEFFCQVNGGLRMGLEKNVIDKPNLRKRFQTLSIRNFYLTHQFVTKMIDDYRSEKLGYGKKFFIKNNK